MDRRSAQDVENSVLDGREAAEHGDVAWLMDVYRADLRRDVCARHRGNVSR